MANNTLHIGHISNWFFALVCNFRQFACPWNTQQEPTLCMTFSPRCLDLHLSLKLCLFSRRKSLYLISTWTWLIPRCCQRSKLIASASYHSFYYISTEISLSDTFGFCWWFCWHQCFINNITIYHSCIIHQMKKKNFPPF